MKVAEAIKYKYTVLGAGRSGLGAAKLLAGKGAEVFLSDSSPEDKLLYLLKEDLNKLNIEFETGIHSDKIFDCDILIKSPGIPPHSDIIKKAEIKGIKIFSEIEVAFWFCPCPVIAITGTNGKTTTTVLTGEIIRNCGFDVKVCGNLGLAFSEVVKSLKKNSFVVLETSSFQLYDTEEFKPDVSVILNLTPDHIDWHGSVENYFNAKLKINQNQKSGEDYFIYNYDDGYLREKLKSKKLNGTVNCFGFDGETILRNFPAGCYVKEGDLIFFNKNKNISETILNINEIKIRGRHNVYNSMAAVLSAKSLGIETGIVGKTLKEFTGVEHRIEFVRNIGGVEFYNDSKATNFESTYVALESFAGRIILILGGKKGVNNFSLIEEFVKEKVKLIISIGQTKDDIKKYFSEFKEVVVCDEMVDAVRKSFIRAEAGDVILFSPAFKSFDMFDNFEHRGNEFKKCVNSI
ncbi:MAG: UDP-N-acetylmuramoyl-L-alanine--D-glutamate ligase [Ignavibacteria bacterium]|nr:UDP-N-acetylmuramoyl-L-alanine--D-glutamate ligase [Ignavibacteria bacterium]